MEVYPLKAVVGVVAKAQGESPPTQLRGTAFSGGPWDGFFGVDLSY